MPIAGAVPSGLVASPFAGWSHFACHLHPPVWASRLTAPDHHLTIHLHGGLTFCDIFFPLYYFVHPLP